MSGFFGPSRKKAPKLSKKGSGNHWKSIEIVKKRVDFWSVFLWRFWDAFWSKKGPQGGGWGLPKSDKKVKKTVSRVFWGSTCSPGPIFDEFGTIFWRFYWKSLFFLDKTYVFEVRTRFLESLFRASKSQHSRGKDVKNTAKNNMEEIDGNFDFLWFIVEANGGQLRNLIFD